MLLFLTGKTQKIQAQVEACSILKGLKNSPANLHRLHMKGTLFSFAWWRVVHTAQVKTPDFSLSRASREREDRREEDLREESRSLPLLLERLDRRLRSSPLLRACRYFRCISARRRRRFVNRIPVNITNEASSSNPPATYLSFVNHVCLPVEDFT